MTEQDSTKLLFLFEQYRPEPHAVKASDAEMTNLPSVAISYAHDRHDSQHVMSHVASQVWMASGKAQFKN